MTVVAPAPTAPREVSIPTSAAVPTTPTTTPTLASDEGADGDANAEAVMPPAAAAPPAAVSDDVAAAVDDAATPALNGAPAEDPALAATLPPTPAPATEVDEAATPAAQDPAPSASFATPPMTVAVDGLEAAGIVAPEHDAAPVEAAPAETAAPTDSAALPDAATPAAADAADDDDDANDVVEIVSKPNESGPTEPAPAAATAAPVSDDLDAQAVGFQDLDVDATRESIQLHQASPPTLESDAVEEIDDAARADVSQEEVRAALDPHDSVTVPIANSSAVNIDPAGAQTPASGPTGDEERAPLPDSEGFAPPNLDGVRSEVTRPLRSPFFAPEDGEAPAEGKDETQIEAAAENVGSHTREMSFPDQAISTDESRTVEGAPFMQEAFTPAVPPSSDQVLIANNGEKVRLTAPLGDQGGSTFFRASVEGEDQAYTAVWTPEVLNEPPWAHLPDPRIVRPRARVELEGATLRVFERPKGNTVVDYLLDPDRFLPAMATLELGIELAEILESLHGSGLFLYDLDPSQVVIEKGGRVRLYPIGGFYRSGELPHGPSGPFAAPEVRRGYRYRIGAHSDVYSVALVLWSLLARRSPLDKELDPELLVNPRTFRPECPLGIWPNLQEALLGNTAQRLGCARQLRLRLEKARERLLTEARAADDPESIVLEAWAELHIGLSKARRGAPQQDRAVGVTDEEGSVGLYLIADGVSRSRFGDGAFAAEQVKQAAIQRWSALEKAGPAALALSHPQRQDVLRQIARSAGKRISAEVNARYAPMPNEPNQVMSTTLVAAFVVNGEATIANLGDSRAYLVRDGSIEQITIDHDRTTDGQRMGLSFAEASRMRMGAALTRVVGRVAIQDDGQVRPDPFEPEVFRIRLLPGDRLLLCSDGLADFAAGAGKPAREAERAMREALEEFEDPVRASFEMITLANRAGGYDNISCVVIAAHQG